MKATLFGLAAAVLAGSVIATPASALPLVGGFSSSDNVQKAHFVKRKVIHSGPRCETIVTKRIGRFGRKVVSKTRRCI